MSDFASLCLEGDQTDMGSIKSLEKNDGNQDFCTEGVTRGVEDDVPDDDCILSDSVFNVEPPSGLDKVCGDSVNDSDRFIMNDKTVDTKEKSLTKCVVALQDQQCGDYVKDVSTECVPSTTNVIDKDITNKNMTAVKTKMHYDKCRTSFSNKHDVLPETGDDNTVTKCQIKEENHLHPHEASGEKKSEITADISKAQSCSMQTDETVDCTHTISGKNNENHIYKRSFIIETLINILNRKGKQLENNIPVAGDVTASVKLQNIDSKRANKGHFHFSSGMSVSPTENFPSNTDAGQVRKPLKSGFGRVITQLEKLQQDLDDTMKFNTGNSFALTTSESLKNQIKGMTTAVTQMYHIVCNTPQKNISFLNTLNQMAMQLSKVNEILKSHDTIQDPVTYLLHFQGTLDSLKDCD